jgi:hypothetical protein
MESMEVIGTPLCEQRILIIPEAFGYGPTAACADFFMPHLRKGFRYVGFAGSGHTLDLHRKLPYDEIHDLSGLEGEALRKVLFHIFSQYDLVLTAMDFGIAEIAVAAGIPVGFYDALGWYWRKLHPVLAKCSFYIAQDFYGVRERIEAEPGAFASPYVVPPIVPACMPWLGKRKHILLNLGGLSNPFMSSKLVTKYARLVTEAFHKAHVGCKDELVIAGNAQLAGELKDLGVRNYTREAMRAVLHKAKYAFMTPGLGNIYDAARYATPTIWLPPANDSQGQQRQLLTKHRASDGCIGWRDIIPGENIDYRAEQTDVLSRIAQAVTRASDDTTMQDRLAAVAARLSRRVQRKKVGSATQLMIEFGWGGAKNVADIVLEQAQKEKRNARTRYGGRRPGAAG